MSTTEEIIETIKERFRSPIIGNFIISFLITNWKIPYITFFVSEDKYPYQTKIDVILNIISSYGCWFLQLLFLLIIPLSWVGFIVFLYPKIQNRVQKIKIDNEYDTKKYEYEKTLEFQSKKNKYEKLTTYHNITSQNSVKELILRIINDKLPIQAIFIGTWNADIQYQKNKENFHENFKQCYFTNTSCINSNKEILFELNEFVTDSESDINNLNTYAYIKFTSNIISEQQTQFHFRIVNRGHIELSNYKDKIYITLRWENIA